MLISSSIMQTVASGLKLMVGERIVYDINMVLAWENSNTRPRHKFGLIVRWHQEKRLNL